MLPDEVERYTALAKHARQKARRLNNAVWLERAKAYEAAVAGYRARRDLGTRYRKLCADLEIAREKFNGAR